MKDHDGAEAMTGRCRARQAQRHYEIRIRCHVGRIVRGAFADLDARVLGTETLLSGALRDQAALYGVPAQIESLGLELLEVRRLPEEPGSSDGADS